MPISESCQRLQLFAVPFDLLLALLLNQTLPAVVSGVAVAMLWMCVFKGELGIVICRWLMAGSVTVLLPGLIIFFFFQKTFVQGVVMSGIKG